MYNNYWVYTPRLCTCFIPKIGLQRSEFVGLLTCKSPFPMNVWRLWQPLDRASSPSLVILVHQDIFNTCRLWQPSLKTESRQLSKIVSEKLHNSQICVALVFNRNYLIKTEYLKLKKSLLCRFKWICWGNLISTFTITVWKLL